MKRKLATIYAVFCTLILVAGFLFVFSFAYSAGIKECIFAIVGFLLGVICSPIVHELGHVVFARAANMDCVYVKCFCFKIALREGKKHFSVASPFAADQTQVLPKTGDDMKHRAKKYTLGGLIFSGIFLFLILTAAILTTCFASPCYLLWGLAPYATYLFLLNVAPFEYAGGKTDFLVYQGIKKGYVAEKNMLSAMEIQGRLYAGESFSEIEEELYFSAPQLCEDEPLFAVMLDLRYRYYLETENLEKAADCLNRLAQTQAYLSTEEIEKLAAELVYMHSLNGDLERANASSKLCESYLASECVTAKRILAAFSFAGGKMDAVEALCEQAKALMATEYVSGVRKFEQILIERIKG